MRGILQKHKKGVSEIVSYSLLIIISIAASVIVYSYLKIYVPKNIPECSDGVSIVVRDYSCKINPDNSANLSLSLGNQGKFSIDAAYIRVGLLGKSTKVLINEANNASFYFAPPLSPNQSYFNKNFSIPSSVIAGNPGQYVLEIEPALVDSSTNILAACENSIITQNIQCTN